MLYRSKIERVLCPVTERLFFALGCQPASATRDDVRDELIVGSIDNRLEVLERCVRERFCEVAFDFEPARVNERRPHARLLERPVLVQAKTHHTHGSDFRRWRHDDFGALRREPVSRRRCAVIKLRR
jgi:hypothetical protein